MINSFEISLMTTYLPKSILAEYRDNIRPIETSIEIPANVNEIDIKKILVSTYNDQTKIAFRVKQLEALARVYQIHKKQENYQDLNKKVHKYLRFLDIRKLNNL